MNNVMNTNEECRHAILSGQFLPGSNEPLGLATEIHTFQMDDPATWSLGWAKSGYTLTSHISHITSHISHPSFHISHLTSHISHLTSHISHLTSHISHLTSHISHLPSHISHLTSHISHLTSHIIHHPY